MVMGKDHGCRTVGDDIGEDFSWMNLTSIKQSHGDNTLLNNLIGAVEGNTDKIFLFLTAISWTCGSTSFADSIFTASGAMKRRASSKAATSWAALALPIPSTCVK